MAATRKYPVELGERAVRLYRESDPKPVIAQLARTTQRASGGLAELDPPRTRPTAATERPTSHI